MLSIHGICVFDAIEHDSGPERQAPRSKALWLSDALHQLYMFVKWLRRGSGAKDTATARVVSKHIVASVPEPFLCRGTQQFGIQQSELVLVE